jgi:glutaredoxin
VANSLKLYVKTWCPWCVGAKKQLTDLGFQYQEIDVEATPEAYAEMIQISGQRFTPTLLVGEKVLPDFGPEELTAFLKEHQIEP